METVRKGRGGQRSRGEVYRQIKDSIQYLEWMPGSVIHEVELVERLGVSRTPIREALLHLASEYLVDIYPQRGTYVSAINFHLAKECTYMRHILDSEVCMELCRKRVSLQRELEEQMYLMSFAVKKKDIIKYIQCDNDFHGAVFAQAGHEMTWEIISNSRAHYNRVLTLDLKRPGALEQSFEDHKRLIQYMESGDGVALAELMEKHHDYRDMDEREKEIKEMFPEYF